MPKREKRWSLALRGWRETLIAGGRSALLRGGCSAGFLEEGALGLGMAGWL